jgi:NADH-quinone oxidoreductase subunit J
MATIGTVEAVGDVLYTDYLLPFELTAILLTAAVVGALMIAQHKIKRTDEI